MGAKIKKGKQDKTGYQLNLWPFKSLPFLHFLPESGMPGTGKSKRVVLHLKDKHSRNDKAIPFIYFLFAGLTAAEQ
jgi:hypothetical protein